MDIKVNDKEWNSLSDEDQKKIEDAIKGYFKGSKIVPDSATPHSGISIDAFKNPFCTIACDAAQKAAEGACFALANPIAIALCLAAAKAAGDACRRNC